MGRVVIYSGHPLGSDMYTRERVKEWTEWREREREITETGI